MRLLPEGSLAYRVFDKVDRKAGDFIFGEPKWVSTHLGNRQKDGTAHCGHLLAIAVIDMLTLERGHCFKNAGKK